MPFIDQAIGFARRACGSVSEQELSSEDIKAEILPDVVDDFSNLFPKVGQYTITLVADQGRYPLPDPRILSIKQFNTVGPFNRSNTGLVGDGYAQQKHLSGYREFSSEWIASYDREMRQPYLFFEHVEVIGAEIEVIPTPKAGDTLHIRTHDMWDLVEDADFEGIPHRLRRSFRNLLGAAMADAVALRRDKVPTITIGPSSARLGVKELRRRAIELRDKALASAPSIGGYGGVQG